MNRKIYKRLMIAGLLPFRADMLKKPKPISEEKRLLRDGWQYVNQGTILKWKGMTWTLLYKVIDNFPHKLPGFEPIDFVRVINSDGTVIQYQYIEFMAINHESKTAELYAYGNFLKGENKPYIMKGKQVIRVEGFK